jgi:hypothetical protein
MARYAARTPVSAAASREEIQRTLSRYGATEFGYAQAHHQAAILFVIQGWYVRIVVPMPARDEHRFTRTPTGLTRSPQAQQREYDQAVRQRWRALVLVIKAKLEAVEAGITTIEEEFLPHIVLPDNRTIGQWMTPQLKRVYAEHEMPALLPGTGSSDSGREEMP